MKSKIIFTAVIFFICSFICSNLSFAQTFEKIDVDLPGLSHGKVNWLDINNDGYLDIFVSGENDSLSPGTHVFLNNGKGEFTPVNTGIPHFSDASVSWSDYDMDGDLDMVVCAYSLNHNGVITRIYKNIMPFGFTEMDPGFVNVYSGSVKWVDYNNDGMSDVLLTGLDSDGFPQIKLYKNNMGLFTEVNITLPALYNSTMEFYDFDKDGDQDLLMSGQSDESKNSFVTKIFLNEDHIFTDSGILLPGMSNGSASWGDFNADGYADILINGETTAPLSRVQEYRVMIFHNNGDGTFSEHFASLPGVAHGNVLWADFDNDGYFDILMTGNFYGNSQGLTRIFRNNNGTFTEVNNSLPNVTYGNVSIGDFNNDFKLDILVTGHNYSGNKNISSVYKNLIPVANEAPVEPKGLTTTFDNLNIHFNWFPGFDNSTPSPGLTYNLRLGTTPGGSEIISPSASGVNAFSILPGHGNTDNDTGMHIIGLDSGTYYWSVQTVDNSFNTSEYSAEYSFKYNRNTAGLGDPLEMFPQSFNLEQNYPNPFNPVTKFRYELARDVNVSIKIYDMNGRIVDTPVNEFKKAGSYSVLFNGSNLSSGIYFYNIETENFSQTRKMILVK